MMDFCSIIFVKGCINLSKSETLRRYFLFIVSLFFTAFGVSLAVKGGLGTSPISSFAYVISLNIPFSLGTCLFLWNLMLTILQIVILKKDFQKIQLMQIPLSFIFAWFTDLTKNLINAGNVPDTYIVKLIFVVAGCLSVGMGVSLGVIANVVLNSGEGFVKALSDKFKIKFGNIKIGFDIGCVVLSVVVSLIISGSIAGVREGTIIAAICTGLVVKFIMKFFKAPVCKVMQLT